MTNIVSYVLIALIFLVPFILYKRVYFRPITMIWLDSAESSVRCVSLKPGRRSVSAFVGGDVASCPLKPGYVVFYNPTDVSGLLSYGDTIELGSSVLIATVRHGRFVSSSLSDRSVSDILSKFIFNNSEV